MSKDDNNTEPSIDDIVASIRRIISDEETKVRKPPLMTAPKNEDILELTEMLNDDGSVTPLPRLSARSEAPPAVPFGDIEDEAPIYAAKPEPARIVDQPAPKPDVKPIPPQQPAAMPAPPPPTPVARPADPASAPQPPIASPRMAGSVNTNNLTANSGVTLTPVSSPAVAKLASGGLASPQTAGAAASAFDRLTQAALQQSPPVVPPNPAAMPGSAKSIEDLAREMLRPMLQHWIDSNLPGMVERLVQQEIQRLTKR